MIYLRNGCYQKGKWGVGNGEWGMVVSGNTKKIKMESAQ